MLKSYEQEAHIFIEAIQTIANKPANIANLENYLSIHFPAWLARWANTPADMAEELRLFAEMEI